MLNNKYLQHWRGAVLILAPILFLPLPVLSPSTETRCAYVIIIMACYWVTEAVPLAATGFIPVFAFPLLGVLSTKEVCLSYMKDTNMLFLGGLAMAAAVEHSNLHERIALLILRKVGCSTERLLLGFMMTVMFLSMWISNTAATAMMIPIVDAVLKQTSKTEESISSSAGDTSSQKTDKATIPIEAFTFSESRRDEVDVDKDERNKSKLSYNDLRDILYLGTAYASNIGGTGSLTGTNPNLVLVGFLQLTYPGMSTGINYATWLMYNVPGMVLATILGYLWLRLILLYLSGWKRKSNKKRDEAVKNVLDMRYNSLGPLSFQEGVVAILFGLAVILWIFLKPEVIDGWGTILQEYTNTSITSATPAFLIVFLMFAMPTKPFGIGENPKGHASGCLTWDIFHHKVSWGVIVIIGSGFAMADASQKSGLSAWLGSQFAILDGLQKEVMLIIICSFTALLTEIMSNTAASSLLIPVLNDMSLSIGVNPIYFLLPVTICTSYAFMLPVATPPNAIIFEAAQNMPVSRMMMTGFTMNVLTVASAYLMINTLGYAIFDLNTFPQWANSTTTLP